MGRFDDDDKYRSDRGRDRDRRRSRSRGDRRRSRSRGRADSGDRGGDGPYKRSRSESTASFKDRERARGRRANRKSGWDVMPIDGISAADPKANPQNMGMNTAMQTGIAPNDIGGASFGNKRCREVWVGNLLQGAVSPQHLKDFFTQMFNALPEFQEKYAELIKEGKSAVRDIQMANDGPFGFVEFWTEELAGTAIEFNGVEFMGRPMKTGRPSGFVAMTKLSPPLDVEPLRSAGLLPAQSAMHALGDMNEMAEKLGLQGGVNGQSNVMTANGVQQTLSNNLVIRRQRELYFGNLPQGQLTAESIKQLLTPACELLPDYQKDSGPPIINVNMQNPEQAKFCFVEFQNDKLATAAVPIFNGMEIFSRKMVVARPTGYIDPAAGPEGNVQNMSSVAQFSAAQFRSQNPELAGAGGGSGPSAPVTGDMAAGALAAAAMEGGR